MTKRLRRACHSRDLPGSSDDERPRKALEKPALPQGPQCFDDIFEWDDDVARRSLQLWRLRHVRTSVKKINICMTSSYSGAGFAEAAALRMAAALRKHTLFDVNVNLVSQTEIEPHCQQVLTAPCVFQDILGRVTPDVVEHLKERQAAKRELAKASPHKKDGIGHEFMQEAVAYMKGLSVDAWQAKVWCVKHQRYCRWCPKRLPEWTRDEITLWMEVGGNTCTPWSARGVMNGWLDPQSIPAIVWATSLFVAGGPDVLLNECTPRFQAERFFQCVFDDAIVESVKFSPTDLGAWE